MYSDSVYAVAYENSAAIWVGNNGGLEKFNGSSFTYDSLGGVGKAKLNCIYIDQQGNKWLGTIGYGVVRYDNSVFLTMQQLFGQFAIIGGVWPSQTFSICKGPSGGVSFILNYNNLMAAGLGEITGTSVKLYSQVGYYNGGFSSPRYSMLQYDNSTSQVWYANTLGGSASSKVFLFSFDPSKYVEPISINPGNSDYLDINNVAALVTANADMGWDGAGSKYFVPKTQDLHPMFASSVWMGGYNNSTLHVAAMTYRQNGFDFWPGPLDTITATCDSSTSQLYNKVWKVNRFDIANFIYNWNAGNVQNGTFFPANSILTWPAHGAGNNSRRLAPFVDVNSDGVYDPINSGDYPLIKGDQMIWRVFNDNLSSHSETGGVSFDAEIHASAYAYVCPGIADSNRVLNYTTFYNYKIINRSQNQYDSCYISNWMDSELGNGMDDHIGCDVMNNYGYVLNGDNYDENGYLDNLPVFACNVLNGPEADPNDGWDNNNNGVIDEAGEKNLLHSFSYYTNTGDPYTGNPRANTPLDYYNFMHGIWRNNSPMTYGGNGTISSNPVCQHLFPGNSDPYGISMGGSISNPIPPPGSFGSTGWTMKQAGIVQSDMRFLTGTGPFTMQPGGAYGIDYAFVFSRDSMNCYGDTIIGPDCTLPRATQDNIRVKRWFDNNTFPTCLSLSGIGVQSYQDLNAKVSVYPNPASNRVFVEFMEMHGNTTIEIFDLTGKVVKAGTFPDPQKYLTIPVEDIANGLYFIKIRTASGSLCKKFIKE